MSSSLSSSLSSSTSINRGLVLVQPSFGAGFASAVSWGTRIVLPSLVMVRETLRGGSLVGVVPLGRLFFPSDALMLVSCSVFFLPLFGRTSRPRGGKAWRSFMSLPLLERVLMGMMARMFGGGGIGGETGSF